MGFPDNRDIEPTRDDFIGDFNNHPDFLMNETMDEDQEQMDVEEDDENEGYSRLQTMDNGDEYQPANDSDSSDSDEDDENEYSINSEQIAEENISDAPASIPPILPAEVELQAQVWNTPRSQDSIELSNEKTQQILKAMSKFSLPNVPAWAKEVDPTELLQRLKNKETPSTINDKT